MNKQYSRKLGRIGQVKSQSYHLTIPRDLVHELGWTEGRVILLKRAGKQRRLVLEAHEPWYDKIPNTDK